MADHDRRIEALERRVAALEAELASTRDAAPVPSLQPPPPRPDARPAGAPAPPQPADRPPARAPVAIDSELVLKWGGVGLVVLALAFAVSTAIRRGWMGPELQLLGALLLSAALVVTGLRMPDDRRAWTHTLCSGGIAGLLITFSSNLFLDEFDTAVAYGLVVLVGVSGLALGRVIDSEWVAIVSFAGGAAAWLTIADGDAPFIESGGVLIVGLIAAVATSLERRWVAIRLFAHGLGLASTLAFAVAADDGKQIGATLLLGAVVAAGLGTTPSLGERDARLAPLETQVPTLLAPWALAVIAILFLDTDTSAGLTALAVAAVVAGYAVAARRLLLDGHAVALAVGASVTLTIGIGLLAATDVAWAAVAVQGAGLVFLGRRLPSAPLMILNGGLLLFAAAVFVASDGGEAWSSDAPVRADLARLATLVAVAGGIWLSNQRDVRRVGAIGTLGLTMVWTGSVLVHLPQGQALTSLSWAIIGVAVLATGAIRGHHEIAQVGLGVLGVTVAKLILVDLEEVDALWRAGLFLVIGLTFLRLGYLLPQWTDRRDASTEAVDSATSS